MLAMLAMLASEHDEQNEHHARYVRDARFKAWWARWAFWGLRSAGVTCILGYGTSLGLTGCRTISLRRLQNEFQYSVILFVLYFYAPFTL